ncbi:hypothetical protein DSAG12_03545 [Promethearchaeum syntrophicum]|uniref:PIN domain-containing protein n=1 Tax=Promethearchaeum syntrophicum TaxID=2594042 RepID=A0A5B9DGA3_9ARCH
MATLQKTSNPIFIFDANFFISLKEIKAPRPYINLSLAQKLIKVHFYVSGQIFNECPFIVGTDFQEFEKGVKIGLVRDDEINTVKNDLRRKGVRLFAQDPDLSLIALSKKLKSGEYKKNEIYIVTDDFKLNQNVDTIGYRVKCLSLPAFLQFLGQNLVGKQKKFWKVARKKVLKLNLDYMMSRSTIYAPQAKIAWLIENAVNIAGEGIQLNENTSANIEKEKIKEVSKEEKKLLKICENFIQKKTISKENRKLIDPYKFGLEEIKESRKFLKKAKFELTKNNFRQSLKNIRLANEILNRIFQLMGAKLVEKNYQFFEKLIASEISKTIFLKAYILISLNKVVSALDSLDETALFATISRLPNTVLSINYLKGLLYIFNSFYNKAIGQFEFNYKLAESLKVEKNLAEILKLKAIIGESITSFLIDQQTEALEKVAYISTQIKPSFENLMVALIDSGDYFLAMGFPEIASNLYSEGLECAIDAKIKWKYNFLLSKMKKAYMSSALLGADARPTNEISLLIDKFHDLKDTETFNEIMIELASFTNKFYEPFKFFTKDKRKLVEYYDLHEEFKETWHCVKIEEDPVTNRTNLIGFREEIGLIAFDVQLDSNLEGVPENYSIKLKQTAKIRIDPPESIRETLFLIRAVVKIGNQDRDIEIKRNIPIFFSQMKI